MGELAALGTAFFWSFTSIFFSMSSKKIGSVNVNRIRLAFAVIYLMLANTILQGIPVPLDASLDRWFWLGLSGIVGLVLGDACLLQCYVLIGPRIGTLMMAMAPVIGTLLAWVMLGETLTLLEITGILVAVAGVSWVVLERNGHLMVSDRRRYLLGILFGLGAATGQAGGLVLSKMGLYGGYPALSGVVIRIIVATITIWLLALFSRQAKCTVQAGLADRRVLGWIALGATFGPFLGVWLSLISVQVTYVGIASTLMALTPIIVLPILKWGFKEQVSPRALFGTLVALAGVAILLLPGS